MHAGQPAQPCTRPLRPLDGWRDGRSGGRRVSTALSAKRRTCPHRDTCLAREAQTSRALTDPQMGTRPSTSCRCPGASTSSPGPAWGPPALPALQRPLATRAGHEALGSGAWRDGPRKSPLPWQFKCIVAHEFGIKHWSAFGLPSTVPDELITRTPDPWVCVLAPECGVVALSLRVGEMLGARV